jgi:hypothetical protein
MAIKKVSITYEDDTEATFVAPLDLASLPTESPVGKKVQDVVPPVEQPTEVAPEVPGAPAEPEVPVEPAV